MSHLSRYSRIPVPIKATADQEFLSDMGSIRNGNVFQLQNTKLPNIFSSSNSNMFQKNKSHRLDELIDTDSPMASKNHSEPRPGSMNNPMTYSMHDVSVKRYHSTGQVYPRPAATDTKYSNDDQILWPSAKGDNFNEGYLKMQGIMNAKREDLMRKRGDLKKFGRQPLPPISKYYQDNQQHSSIYSNSDDWDSGSESSFGRESRRCTANSETSESSLTHTKNYGAIDQYGHHEFDSDADFESLTYRKARGRKSKRDLY